MFFPISDAHISPIYLVMVGFLIGILGGFFGVGGSFIAGPALRLAGLDWNFAVGTDLAHIVGKSVVAVRRHRAMGNVDLRLGLIMAVGTICGAEVGAQAIQMLKRAGNINFVVSIVPGGGVALINAISALDAIQAEGDVLTGVNICAARWRSPCAASSATPAWMAAWPWITVLRNQKEQKNPNIGYDVIG